MRAAIVPPEKLPLFDRPLTGFPHIEVGPVLFHSGPHAGSYAINEAILSSCPEWAAVADKALALCAEHGVPIVEIDPADLRDPNQVTF